MFTLRKTRVDLQALLESVLGSKNVYYQPPENLKMHYPAIVYSRDNIDNEHADNTVYFQSHFYEVIVIDKNPDSLIVEAVSQLPGTRYERHYVSDNLNHDVFNMYF